MQTRLHAIACLTCFLCLSACGGDTEKTPRSGPVLASAIAGNDDHTCAILSSDGAVVCWGGNSWLQSGGTERNARITPVEIDGLSNVEQLSAGHSHSCATLQDGSVMCWGGNFSGQLGNDTIEEKSGVPVKAQDISGSTALVSGTTVNCSKKADMTWQCWGGGSFEHNLLPEASERAFGRFHDCALPGDGTVLCWGLNTDGQLGDGTMENSASTEDGKSMSAVAGIDSAVRVASGGESHTCAILEGGSVTCWGLNDRGQLGNGTTDETLTPTLVEGISDAKEIALGAEHSCALHESGEVSCWGNNASGQLGDGTNESTTAPVKVSGLSNATALISGSNHACALTGDETIVCWGQGNVGNLGDGNRTRSNTPVTVTFDVP